MKRKSMGVLIIMEKNWFDITIDCKLCHTHHKQPTLLEDKTKYCKKE